MPVALFFFDIPMQFLHFNRYINAFSMSQGQICLRILPLCPIKLSKTVKPLYRELQKIETDKIN